MPIPTSATAPLAPSAPPPIVPTSSASPLALSKTQWANSQIAASAPMEVSALQVTALMVNVLLYSPGGAT